jgi:hypothetical protein
MAESSHSKHISNDIQAPGEHGWWDDSGNGPHGTWVDGTDIVQSSYTARLAQEQLALGYQAFGEQDKSGMGMEGAHMMDPSGYYGFTTEVEPSGSHWSRAPSWVAPDGTVHSYNDFSSKYLTWIQNDLSISYWSYL